MEYMGSLSKCRDQSQGPIVLLFLCRGSNWGDICINVYINAYRGSRNTRINDKVGLLSLTVQKGFNSFIQFTKMKRWDHGGTGRGEILEGPRPPSPPPPPSGPTDSRAWIVFALYALYSHTKQSCVSWFNGQCGFWRGANYNPSPPPHRHLPSPNECISLGDTL